MQTDEFTYAILLIPSFLKGRMTIVLQTAHSAGSQELSPPDATPSLALQLNCATYKNRVGDTLMT
eukprot:6513782-Ditylum_brightwellii.AAC.1